MMELTVRTLRESVRLTSLPDDITVEDLKQQLASSSMHVPPPESQNLVFAGRLLTSGPLKTAGVSAGSTLVVINAAPHPKPAPLASSPAPSASEIRAAIFDYARRKGLDHKLSDEGPALPSTTMGLPHDLLDMDSQLVGLIEALEGRLGLLRQGGQQAASAGSGPGQAGEAARAGPGAAAGAAEPAEEPDIVPPEPEAEHVSQLCDMGFSDALARKALILHRNRVPEAVDWLLQHADDADADAPITQEQLRMVYGTMRRAPAAAVANAAAGGGDASLGPAASGAVANALRGLHMSLLQAVGMDMESAEGVLAGRGNREGGDAGGDAGQVQGDNASTTAAAATDPLAAFRRRLQQHLGEGGEDAVSLSELFPLEALMNLGAPHDGDDEDEDQQDDEDDDDDHHHNNEDDDEDEDEDDELDDENGEDDDESQAHNADSAMRLG